MCFFSLMLQPSLWWFSHDRISNMTVYSRVRNPEIKNSNVKLDFQKSKISGSG
ncbi:hypothetical protein Syun_019444 [Stephania yunnanensis]|uniref:Uncharacterized protein n=1 Tax=Stephania yunnanensis TaxID=152371 RepID=A0AAP0IU39_9MAGN